MAIKLIECADESDSAENIFCVNLSMFIKLFVYPNVHVYCSVTNNVLSFRYLFKKSSLFDMIVQFNH